ncbi:MAG: sigma-70 family RNA polymerase sigma factor [Thermogutta sp.]|nr:sigma-70 family RNA polymerase sigma factor [Thermogutta sp.]
MVSDREVDWELLQQARRGDFSAFEALVARYERRIFGLARRIVRNEHDAEEVVQQTFITLLEHLHDFRGESAFATWLLRIASNHSLALLRREAVRATATLADDIRRDGEDDPPFPSFIAEWRETPDQILGRAETGRILQEAMDQLDDKYRLTFLLRDVEGLSTAETAEALGITESNVKVRLLRARLMLREKLTRLFGDEARAVEPHSHDDI